MIGQSGQKIFTSANKLFTLSKFHPVGIMVYGSAVFMGVPWETIIKIYRKNLGKKKFSTLKKYANDFIGFLDNGNSLFPDSVQEEYLRSSIYGYFNLIKKMIMEKVHSVIEEKGKITEGVTKEITSEIIKEHYEKWDKTQNIKSIPKSYNTEVIEKYGKIMEGAIKEVFEKLPVSKNLSNQLKSIASSLFSKFPERIQKGNVSGIVIAGFGQKDTFPSLESFHIEGIVNNRLKYKEYIASKINFKQYATIIPFAQGEMVATFMEGIDPYLQNHLEGYLSEIFEKYPEIITEKISQDIENIGSIKEKLKKASKKILKDFFKNINNFRREKYVDPIISVVAMLPKDELAEMAESLVNLTVFKQKVSIASETVVGPINVAVVSKGDGFVWIKRKHYFKAELNPRFFANYYREV